MKPYKEIKKMPIFILVIFIVQFFVFLLYSISNSTDISLLYFSIGILLIGGFLAFTRLVLRVDENVVMYRFTPFMSNKILWSAIKKAEIVKLSAIGDFLGWGIRYSRKYGWGYITNSEYGLFIEKINGKKVTISIDNKEVLEAFLKEKNLVI